METEETKFSSEIKREVVQIFSQFMSRVANFDELVAAGNRFLVIFHQALDFMRRPSIENTSELFKQVTKANNTERMQSYIQAGYTHTSDRAESLNKSKNVIKELECLVEDLNLAIESANETLQDHDLDPVAATCNEEAIDYATMVAVVYSMMKKDYAMQEKIVNALSLKTTSGELETYCFMWSLRPFVNDETMHQAWKLIR